MLLFGLFFLLLLFLPRVPFPISIPLLRISRTIVVNLKQTNNDDFHLNEEV